MSRMLHVQILASIIKYILKMTEIHKRNKCTEVMDSFAIFYRRFIILFCSKIIFLFFLYVLKSKNVVYDYKKLQVSDKDT